MEQHAERPTRIWLLHGIGEGGSDVWCDEPDPDGGSLDVTEYVRADVLKALEALCGRLRMEAEIWAQEARTQKSTVHECYQAVTGATGEPGDWNGSRPVVERIKTLEAENARLRGELRRSEAIADELFDEKATLEDDLEEIARADR